ncbi:MAG: spiro-SPASM protein [Treponema sp.]|nr:spiro-SPASM protein [Treponema sp.]
MKRIVFLFAGFDFTHAFDKAFASVSAFDRTLVWAKGLCPESEIYVAVNDKTSSSVREALESSGTSAKTICRNDWNTKILLEQMSRSASQSSADYVVYTLADRPFLDAELSRKVIENHEEYLAEYTFADGYPLGFAPETIDSGALGIISTLASREDSDSGTKPVSASSIFSVMQKDINSFEIEAVIAPKDYRMLRLDFSCGTKANFLSCRSLYDSALDSKIPFNASSLTGLAEKSVKVQRTVPAFYNIQISARCWTESVYSPYFAAFEKKYSSSPLDLSFNSSKIMRLEQFRALVSSIAEFSETAVVGLGEWGEPMCVDNISDYISAVLEHPGLSVLVETDGILIKQETVEKIAAAVKSAVPRTSGEAPVTWIVSVDAFTAEKYGALHPRFATDEKGVQLLECNSAFAKAVNAVSILETYFEGCVYPQMLRMNANEDELEQFYRFWHGKDSPSKGKIIIQKYDHFCGLMPDEKPADLSPLKRNPCWHLKRDMVVLWNGDVPFCREWILDNSVGNVFEMSVKAVWEKLEDFSQKDIDCCNCLCSKTSLPDVRFDEKCGACDEYYTYNF